MEGQKTSEGETSDGRLNKTHEITEGTRPPSCNQWGVRKLVESTEVDLIFLKIIGRPK